MSPRLAKALGRRVALHGTDLDPSSVVTYTGLCNPLLLYGGSRVDVPTSHRPPYLALSIGRSGYHEGHAGATMAGPLQIPRQQCYRMHPMETPVNNQALVPWGHHRSRSPRELVAAHLWGIGNRNKAKPPGRFSSATIPCKRNILLESVKSSIVIRELDYGSAAVSPMLSYLRSRILPTYPSNMADLASRRHRVKRYQACPCVLGCRSRTAFAFAARVEQPRFVCAGTHRQYRSVVSTSRAL
jgi:hypothetical protein